MPESYDWLRPEPAEVFFTEYTVIEGDTLETIALVQLGSAERWPEIQTLNNLEDGAVLVAAQVLRLPPRIEVSVAEDSELGETAPEGP